MKQKSIKLVIPKANELNPRSLCSLNLLVHQTHCIADLTKINFDIFDNAAFENNAESISRTCLDKHHKKTSWFKYKLLAYYHNNIDIF